MARAAAEIVVLMATAVAVVAEVVVAADVTNTFFFPIEAWCKPGLLFLPFLEGRSKTCESFG